MRKKNHKKSRSCHICKVQKDSGPSKLPTQEQFAISAYVGNRVKIIIITPVQSPEVDLRDALLIDFCVPLVVVNDTYKNQTHFRSHRDLTRQHF